MGLDIFLTPEPGKLPTTSIVTLGKRASDVLLRFNFQKERALIRCETKFVEGIRLEEIQIGRRNLYPGIVLINRKWKNIYVMNVREKLWIEDHYFFWAEKQIQLLGCERD